LHPLNIVITGMVVKFYDTHLDFTFDIILFFQIQMITFTFAGMRQVGVSDFNKTGKKTTFWQRVIFSKIFQLLLKIFKTKMRTNSFLVVQ